MSFYWVGSKNSMDFSKSKCIRNRLHKFTVIDSKNDSVLERCVRCGKKHVIKLVNGGPNTVEYARWHLREFLIPQHPRFGQEFKKIYVG